jgi:hypothetical protein
MLYAVFLFGPNVLISLFLLNSSAGIISILSSSTSSNVFNTSSPVLKDYTLFLLIYFTLLYNVLKSERCFGLSPLS